MIERKASAEEEVLVALAAVAGGEPKVADVDRLILRAPPTEKELDAFAAGDDDGSKALEGFVRAIAEEQLFGAGRKLTVLAMKGEATPLRKVVERAARSAKEGQDGEVSS